jgi:hypothetical protein
LRVWFPSMTGSKLGLIEFFKRSSISSWLKSIKIGLKITFQMFFIKVFLILRMDLHVISTQSPWEFSHAGFVWICSQAFFKCALANFQSTIFKIWVVREKNLYPLARNSGIVLRLVPSHIRVFFTFYERSWFSGRIRTFYRRKTDLYEKKFRHLPLPSAPKSLSIHFYLLHST